MYMVVSNDWLENVFLIKLYLLFNTISNIYHTITVRIHYTVTDCVAVIKSLEVC